MTRRRIIAGVILLAAVVVAVPFVPGAWRTLAYHEVDLSGFLVFEIRWSWLPGPKVIARNQPCIECNEGCHRECTRSPEFSGECWLLISTSRDASIPHEESVRLDYPPTDFTCTCTDPSHDGEQQ